MRTGALSVELYLTTKRCAIGGFMTFITKCHTSHPITLRVTRSVSWSRKSFILGGPRIH